MRISEFDTNMVVNDLPRPWVELHWITPENAQKVLDKRNGKNRKMREWWAKILAHSMSTGNWHITTSSIGFDSDGNLVNGQHTLRACVISGKPIKSFVAFNLHPRSFEVIDIGVKRRVQDQLRMEKDFAEVVRLATIIYTSRGIPMSEEMRVVSEAGLLKLLEELREHCGKKVKFFSSVPMRLAACATVILTSNREYVFNQYEALCQLDFDKMSRVGQMLVRQVASNKANSMDTSTSLARGLIVLDPKNKNLQRIYAEGPENAAWARETVRKAISKIVEES